MIDLKAFIKRNLVKLGIDITKTKLYKDFRLYKQADKLIKEGEVVKKFNSLNVDRFINALNSERDIDNRKEKQLQTKLSVLLFSFDRAFQLYSLLSSIFDNFLSKEKINITVLYRVSNIEHENSYKEIRKIFELKGVKFVKQETKASFKSDLMNILTGFKSEKVMFLVDDIVITSKIDLDQLLDFDGNYFIPSLRLGKNIKKNYTLQQPLELPPFLDSAMFKQEGNVEGLNFWRWKDGGKWKEFDLDWRYVVSVDGNIFNLDEMILFIDTLEVKSPNVLENLLDIRYSELLKERIGICFDVSKMVNLPINQVHIEGSVNIAENIKTPDFLLKKWQEGYVMDYKSFYGHISQAPHEELDFKYLKR